ncbi:MAG TPA: DUF2066 domain-containing protein [Steroidobacteraceae bacterium]|nr:DUF2066 domain-containing protein [Steroidobacteraceae bacterium]
MIAFMVLAPQAWAGRVVRLYDVIVKGDASGPVVQDAMRRVLVRATGRREAAADPALSTIVADAAKYVQSSTRVANGDTRISFDGSALEQAIAAAGRSVWDSERPFTLVVFTPPLSGATAETVRVELERAAETRGLPISLAPVPVTDANGVELPKDVVLQGAQRLGGDAVLIARGDSAALNGVYQWTLQTQYGTENWNGALDAGVNGAVDALARVQDAGAPLTELEAVVQVGGVATLNDYAAVSRLLEGIPGTRRVNLSEVNGGAATFTVLVRGGAEAIDRALSNSGRLTRAGAGSGGQLVYEYRP